MIGVKKQSGGMFEAKDFLLKFDIDREPPKPQTAADIERHFRAIARANNKLWEIREARKRSVVANKR